MQRSILAFGALVCLVGGLASPAAAANLQADFSSLGTIYVDASNNIFTTNAPGRTDITNLFKNEIDVSLSYFNASIGVNWTEKITYTLASLGAGTIADAAVNHTDANGRPDQATIRFNTDASVNYFIDSTPWDNSEFSLSSSTAALGGGNVNNSRQGAATATGGAAGLWDLLTLALHEDEHAIGISSGLARFTDLAGASGNTGRVLTIPKALSGLTNNFDIPITQNSAHYNGGCTLDPPDCTADDVAKGSAIFNLSVVSQPGWGKGTRALPTALDYLGICQVEGCTAAQTSQDIITPEPLSLSLLAGGLVVITIRRRRASHRSTTNAEA
jgi:hypothetical protein